MIVLPKSEIDKLTAILVRLDDDYQPYRGYHQEIAQYLLPMRYNWLESTTTQNSIVRQRIKNNRNTFIVDSYGTKMARDLAAGMLNGVASPAREWFSLRLADFHPENKPPIQLLRWLDEIKRRMFLVLGESNFYNSFALLLLDMVVFGTAGMLVYEDYDDVVRFYNLCAGEYKLAQDHRRDVNTMGRFDVMTVEQVVSHFGLENVTQYTAEKYRQGAQHLYHGIRIGHLIEPNRDDARKIPGSAPFREFYWEVNNNHRNQLLSRAIFNERPGAFPRWELIGNEVYGLSPGMDALPDVIQLQHETLRKAEGLDKMTDPPTVLDAALRNGKNRSQAGDKLYVPSFSTVGGKALYQVQIPLAELSADIREVQSRIGAAFFNDLFRMISQLDTVRSATEIDARREEKLILMGAVLERLENEALDPIMQRVFGIMKRKGLIPPPPDGFEEQELQIQYVSLLSDAQRAAGTSVIERYLQVAGNVMAIEPSIKHVVHWHEILREYGSRLNVPAVGIRPREETMQLMEEDRGVEQAQQVAQIGADLTGAAKNLADTDLGGGQNAFQALLGG